MRNRPAAMLAALILTLAAYGCGASPVPSVTPTPAAVTSPAVTPTPSPGHLPTATPASTPIPTPSPTPSPDPSPEPDPSPDPSPEPSPEPEPEFTPFEMIFTGDVLLDASVGELIRRSGLTAPISEDLMLTLAAAELTGINLEMPFSERGEPEENKQYTFRGDPAAVELLPLMGVNYCALANNHTLDYGVEALLDTIALLNQQGIGHSGAGINLEAASRPAEYEFGGRRVAVLSASRVLPRTYWYAREKSAGLLAAYDPGNLVRAVRAAKETADIVVVFVHWGVERSYYPEDYQQTLARRLADAGADVIVGAHPHVLQGFEFIGDSLVAYSLGNFIFNNSYLDTAALRVSVGADGGLSFSVIPCRITGQSTGFMPAGEQVALFDTLTERSFHAQVDGRGGVIPKLDEE